jgi:hypothetical protein
MISYFQTRDSEKSQDLDGVKPLAEVNKFI